MHSGKSRFPAIVFLAVFFYLSPAHADPAFEKDKVEQGQLGLTYARTVRASGDWNRARSLLLDLLLLYPGHPENGAMLTELAELSHERGAIEEAIYFYRRAFSEGKNHEQGSRSYLKAGQLAAQIGETALARTIFEKLVKERPHEPVGREAQNRLDSLGVLDLLDAPARPASEDG